MTRGRKAALEKAIAAAGNAVTTADKTMVAAQKNLISSDKANGKLVKGSITTKGIKTAQKKLKEVKKDHSKVVSSLKKVQGASKSLKVEATKALKGVVDATKKAAKAKTKSTKVKTMQEVRKRRTSLVAAMNKIAYLQKRSNKLRDRAKILTANYKRYIAKAKKANTAITNLKKKIKMMEKKPTKKMGKTAVKRTRRASATKRSSPKKKTMKRRASK